MIFSGPKCRFDKDDFLSLIVERLGAVSIDFSEKMNFIYESRKSDEPAQAAGVLLPLHYREKSSIDVHQDGDFTFLLIKRSSKVSQPGDLSCPGGMLNGFIDPLFRPAIASGLFPILRGKAFDYARQREKDTFRKMTLFLTNAVRETWEETNICPSKIAFLGPLPTYSLHLFRRTIFPLVGYVKQDWHFRSNSEVDRIVEIPLHSFFQEENYAVYRIELAGSLASEGNQPQDFPCLIYRDDKGHEDILWGATFYIIINFLHIVLDFGLPAFSAKRIVKKVINRDYLTGEQN
jgi:8-oxo-dGTP pyrophosphatase MutT (NUDIX family)